MGNFNSRFIVSFDRELKMTDTAKRTTRTVQRDNYVLYELRDSSTFTISVNKSQSNELTDEMLRKLNKTSRHF